MWLSTMFEVRGSYSFWGEESKSWTISFDSVWAAYDHAASNSDVDTAFQIFRVEGGCELEIPLKVLEKRYYKTLKRERV